MPSTPRPLRIGFYAPFKPLGHANPSGDAVTAAGIFDYLSGRGHEVFPVSSLRCRWIYWRPWLWARVLREIARVSRRYPYGLLDVWLTYHSYYKAPDLLGPFAARRMKLPYVIFQGIYSTKRKRKLRTLPGFHLNKKALLCAQHIFTNKKVDLLNLKRLLPENRITYVPPGIHPDEFAFNNDAREQLRREWHVGDDPVIFSAAMFRPDVKTEGLVWLIRACGLLYREGHKFRLTIAGDGREKKSLMKLAQDNLPDRVRFVGKIPRREMYRYYSACDLFVFPGIRESLGMVYLEAQSCGLPVVAFDNAGVPEAVQDGKTGILVPMYALRPFANAIKNLLKDEEKRRQMGQTAQRHVRDFHDLEKNYRKLEKVLRNIVGRYNLND
jgi:glycosyltransferase involved in cell wall biosynthesis